MNDDVLPQSRLKRVFDILLSGIALVGLSPFYLLIAILIKGEGLINKSARGPVFRTEERISHGRPFHLIKFRLIRQSVLDEEDIIRRRDRQKSLEKDENCTVVGRCLKKFYLDELPQIWNIFKGDMSWVGPRPFPVDDYKDDLSKGRNRKKVVIAGLTGLVQIHKGKKTVHSDVELDNAYISEVRKRSSLSLLWYDFTIMVRTIKVLLESKGL